MAVTDEDEKLLEKLTKLLEKEESIEELDKKEIEIVRKMIATYESFKAFGRLSSAARNIVIWLGVMLGAYFTLQEFIVNFIKSHAGG